uniref:EGF-like domain-containing protein n=1 Tax=Ditylenchus dipsaci TaxID=166011 RepID=A0A915DR71_9BILA
MNSYLNWLGFCQLRSHPASEETVWLNSSTQLDGGLGERGLSKRDAGVQQSFNIDKPSDKFPTIYYICGEYPNQVYSITPCQVCRNGGRDLQVGCTSAIQCTPYFRGVSACIDGRCCTSGANTNNPDPNLPDAGLNTIYNPYSVPSVVVLANPGTNNQYDNTNNGLKGSLLESREFGYCPRGDRSNIRCSAIGQCPMNHICLNGMCCPKGTNDYLQACGGQMAIAACAGGTCLEGMVCTASDYCCQCPVGRSGGRCNQGGCAPGYRCHTNGYCCSWCPDNTTPFGTCKNNQQCAPGFQCRAGDICCQEQTNAYLAAQYVPYGGYVTNGA